MVRERAPWNSVNHPFRSRCSTPAKPLKLKYQFFVTCTSIGLSAKSAPTPSKSYTTNTLNVSASYLPVTPHDVVLEGLEHEAREAKEGLWADPQPVPPWEWRMSAEAIVVFVVTSSTLSCIGWTKQGSR